MTVFDSASFTLHREVVFCNDPSVGLRAIIAIHDLTFGPALGGLRIFPYPTEDEAIEDVLRLARGMTYKTALARLALGGGKAVIIADPKTDKSEPLLRSFGCFVDSLRGRYITAEDVGSSVTDMQVIRKETHHVRGIPETGGGDPSPVTAFGVYQGIRAAAKHKLHLDSLAGLRIAVQGLGHVGLALCRRLTDGGARITATDIDGAVLGAAANELGLAPVAPDEIVRIEADVFAPCALGAVLNDETIPELRVSIIAGAANNQLEADRHGAMLHERGILYVPDYAINAGGIINAFYEGPDYDRQRALAHAARIYETLLELFARAEAQAIPTNEMADRIAEERVLSQWDWRPGDPIVTEVA